MTVNRERLSRLPSGDWAALDQVILRFEDAWQKGAPRIDDFLPATGEKRRTVLVELIHIDLERRLLAGESTRVESYLTRYPELAAQADIVLELVVREHELRRGRDPRVTVDEYYRRFPSRRADLSARLASRKKTTPRTEPPAPGNAADKSTVTFHKDSQRTQTYAGGKTPSATEEPPPLIPGFEIEGILGRGGMGVVYKAKHLGLKRTVAIKMILSGAFAGPVEVARFKAEAEAVAQLQHPSIVQVYEIGEVNGSPFFSLEFVDGGSLAGVLKGKPVGADVAAKLIEALAEAMQYAHERGIVHRDLKPANILLQKVSESKMKAKERKRKPSANVFGALKVTDFGLAKQLGNTDGRTATGAIMGTPSYMAPEQASGNVRNIGPGADVYALGAILYELLTGKPPFRGATLLDTLEQVRLKEPTPPSQTNPKVPRDLETICLKCLQKDIEKRYPSARELADDLRRFLDGEPISARPYGRAERVWRWCRRNPVLAGLGMFVAITLVFGGPLLVGLLTFSVVQTSGRIEADRLRALETDQREKADRARVEAERQKFLADQQKQRAEEQERLARQWSYFARIQAADRAWQDAQLPRMDELLDQTMPEHTNNVDMRGFEWYYLKRLGTLNQITLKGHGGPVMAVAFSPRGDFFASAGTDGTVVIYDAKTNKKVKTLRGLRGDITSVAFSPNGSRILGGGQFGADGGGTGFGAKVWEVATGEVVLTVSGHAAHVMGVAYSENAKLIATASTDHMVKVWNAANGELITTFKGHGASVVQGVAFSPDSLNVASCGSDSVLRIWEAATGTQVAEYKGDGWGTTAAYSPKGALVVDNLVATGVNVWHLAKHTNVTLETHNADVTCIAFSRDGRRMATASADLTVKVWDMDDDQPRELQTLRGHRDAVLGVAFSPDRKQLITGSADGTVKVWPIDGDPPNWYRYAGKPYAVNFHPDNKRIGYGGSTGTGQCWDFTAGKFLMPLPQDTYTWIHSMNCSPDGIMLVVTGTDSAATIWEKGPVKRNLVGHKGTVPDAAFSPDNRRIATVGQEDGTFKMWDPKTAEALYSVLLGDGPHCVAYSPDGAKVAVGLCTTIKIFEASTGKELMTIDGAHKFNVLGLSYSPDGRYLASCSWDQTVKLWETETYSIMHTCKGHTHRVCKVVFSPDSKRLFSSSFDHTIRIWDVASGQEALTLRGHTAKVMGIAITTDGKHLASASNDGTVRVWDGSP